MKSSYKPLFLFIILTITGCNSDDNFVEPTSIENIMNVSIDDEEYRVINENVSGNENCDKLFVSTFYYDEDKIKFGLNISLSNSGQLLKVVYNEMQYPSESPQVAKYFLTPNFNPTETFNISNFYYNQENGNLTFNFSGIVYFEEDNNQQKDISGNIDINSFESINCSDPKFGMSYFSPDFYLYSYDWDSTKYADGTQRHRFFSNNGYILDINVDEDFWLLPIGTIEFNESSYQNKVSLQKQLGDIIANQTPNTNDHDWLNYITDGEIIIEEKIIENGYNIVIGKINLDVIENDIILHSLNGIEFRTISFEN